MKHRLLLLLLAGLARMAACGGSTHAADDPAAPTAARDGGSDGGLLPFGAACAANAQCESNVCFVGGNRTFCSLHCTSATPPPTARCRPPPARATCRATASRSLRRRRARRQPSPFGADAREHERRAAARLPVDRARAPQARRRHAADRDDRARAQGARRADPRRRAGAHPRGAGAPGRHGHPRRRARRQAVLACSLLIDGVPSTEPYFGIFDVSSIPITDIVEIRVQLAPASPLEGPGGDGGIVEVTTLRALGSRLIDARVVGGSTPEGEAALTGRTPLGARRSASAPRPARALRRSDLPRPRHRQDSTRAASTTASRTSTARCGSSTRPSAATSPATPSTATARSSFRRRTPRRALLQHITGRGRGARWSLGSEIRAQRLRASPSASTASCCRARPTILYRLHADEPRRCHQDLFSGRFGGAVHVDRPFRLRGLARHRLGAPLRRQRRASVQHIAMANGHARPTGRSRPTASSPSAQAALALALRPRPRVGALVPFEQSRRHLARGQGRRRLPPAPDAQRATHRRAQGAPADAARALRSDCRATRRSSPSRRGTASCSCRSRRTARRRAALRLRAADRRAHPPRLTADARRQPRHHRRARPRDRRSTWRAISIIGGGGTYIFEDAYSPCRRCSSTPSPTSRAIASTPTSRRRGGALRRRSCASTGSPSGWCSRARLPRYYVMELDVWARIWNTLRASVRIDNLTNRLVPASCPACRPCRRR